MVSLIRKRIAHNFPTASYARGHRGSPCTRVPWISAWPFVGLFPVVTDALTHDGKREPASLGLAMFLNSKQAGRPIEERGRQGRLYQRSETFTHPA